MDTAAVIIEGRTYAPIRYLAEFFGFHVDWDGATRTVFITGSLEDPYGSDDYSFAGMGIDADVDNRTVLLDGNPVVLTPKEFDLLVMFIRNINITLYRDRLYESIWETDWMGDTRTLDLHVQRLRRKLGLKDSLKSVYNTGYRLIE